MKRLIFLLSLMCTQVYAASYIECSSSKNLETILKTNFVRVRLLQDITIPRDSSSIQLDQVGILTTNSDENERLIRLGELLNISEIKGEVENQKLRVNHTTISHISIPANTKTVSRLEDQRNLTYKVYKSGKKIKELSIIVSSVFKFECKQR